MFVTVMRRVSIYNEIFKPCNFLIRSLANGVGDKNILAVPEKVTIPEKTLHEYVFSKIEKFSKYTAFECSISGRSYTFDQIRIKARNFSKALRKKLKLEKGDVVAILLPNVPEFQIAALGILEAGLVITSLNPLYTPEEISRQLKDASAKAIITLNELHDNAEKANALLQSRLHVICIKNEEGQTTPRGAISFEEFTDANIDIPDFHPGNPEDLAYLPYSSGTTGLPKGVKLSHSNIVANLCQADHPDITYVEEATENHQEILPLVMPMFHIYGFSYNGLYMMTKGAKNVTLPRFTPDLYLSVLEKHAVSLILAAPPLVLFLADYADVKKEHLKNVRTVFYGAAPLGVLDQERFLKKCESTLMLQAYGLTETSPMASMVTKKIIQTYENSAGSVGLPIPNMQFKIVSVDDPTGTPLGPNQPGELLVKGPNVMQGYHNKPEETKNAFLDGWLKTGDLMHHDKNGIFWITDRLKELIKVKGFQVAPAELEEIIRDFPSVSDAAVIGVPHPTQGEVPRAYVVPKSGKEVNTKELDAFVAQKVAEYKRLKGGIEVIDVIPKTPSGKILRRELKDKM